MNRILISLSAPHFVRIFRKSLFSWNEMLNNIRNLSHLTGRGKIHRMMELKENDSFFSTLASASEADGEWECNRRFFSFSNPARTNTHTFPHSHMNTSMPVLCFPSQMICQYLSYSDLKCFANFPVWVIS